MKKQKIDEYISSLENIRQCNELTSENIVNIAYAKMLPKYLNSQEFLSNSASANARDGYVSRTALAHKAMFDFCDGTKNIEVYARGLHSNIYLIDFVIESFKNYVNRFVLANKGNSRIPFTLLTREEINSPYSRNLVDSDFTEVADDLANKHGRMIIQIINLPRDIDSLTKSNNVEIKLPVLKELKNKKFVNFSQPVQESIAKELPAFSIFGDFYRLRTSDRDTDSQIHRAYLNFNDCNTVQNLRKIFKNIISCIK